MRRVGWFVSVGLAAYAGVFAFVYLLRWQWNRAMFMALAFLAAEIAIAALVVLRRLDGPEPRTRRVEADHDVLAALRSTRPARQHFAWLDPKRGELQVFITLLVAGGIVVSALAWMVEKLASATGTQALERRLARRMAELAPPGELVVDDGELLAAELPYHPDPELRLLLTPLTAVGDEAEDGPWSG